MINHVLSVLFSLCLAIVASQTSLVIKYWHPGWEKETLSSFCLSGLCLLLSISPCFGHTVFLCVHFCTAQPLDWLSYTSIAILWIFTSCHDLVSLYWTILIWFSTITTTTSKGLLEPTFCAHFYSWVLHIALCSSYLRALWFGRK